MKPVLDDLRISTDKLVIPSNQRKLAAALEKNGAVVDALLFGKLTQGNTTASNIRQADYRLELVLLDIVGATTSGQPLIASEGLRKEYTR